MIYWQHTDSSNELTDGSICNNENVWEGKCIENDFILKRLGKLTSD